VTFGAWAAQWLDGQAHLKPSTKERYAGALRSQVLPVWSRVPLSAISHADAVNTA